MTLPSTFRTLADQYNINVSKRTFPVNTLRLFYLVLAHSYTGGSDDVVETVNNVIPRVSGYLDRGNLLTQRELSDQLTPDEVSDHFEPARDRIFEIIDTPALRYALIRTWEQARFVQQAQRVAQFDPASASPLPSLFHNLLAMRSLDGFVYAATVDAIIRPHHCLSHAVTYHPRRDHPDVFQQTIQLVLQMNDIADAVYYAKQDFASNSAVVIRLVADRVDTAADAIEFLRQKLRYRYQRLQQLPLSQPAQRRVCLFARWLCDRLEGQSVVTSL